MSAGAERGRLAEGAMRPHLGARRGTPRGALDRRRHGAVPATRRGVQLPAARMLEELGRGRRRLLAGGVR